MKQKSRIFRITHLSLSCLARMLVRNLWIIVATALVFGLAVNLCLTWIHVPEYQAKMTYAVNARTTAYTSAGNLTSTREVASVLAELLRTNVMIDGIRNYDSRLQDYDGQIAAEQVGNSNFIVVTATAKTPESAFLALRALTAVFPEVADFISSRSVLVLMKNPTVSSAPINQMNVMQLSKLAGVLGAIAMITMLCLIAIQSETIQTRTGARELLDAPIIASICHERKNRTLKTVLRRSHRQVHVHAPTTSFTYTEQISTVCTHLEHEANANGHKVFMVTGVGENEGKSTVAANVAASLALKGHKVALIDFDLRKPSMNSFFDKVYPSSLPLNKMLSMPYSADHLRQCMVYNEALNLYMLFSLHSDPRSAELLSGPAVAPLLQQMKVFDFVILDTPPMGMFPDAELLAELVDATMLVVRQDYTAACDVNDAVDSLNGCKGAFLGCILNDMRSTGFTQYGYGTKYGYGSKYGYGGKYAYGYHHAKSHSHSGGTGTKDS